MKTHITWHTVVALTLLLACGARAEPAASSYAGQRERAIKSLSEAEVAGLLAACALTVTGPRVG